MNPLSAVRGFLGTWPGASVNAPGSPAQMPLGVRELTDLNPSQGAAGPGAVQPAAFSDVLGKMVQEINQKQVNAGQAVNDLQSGQAVSLHQTMIAMEEASVSFQLMVEVRNKLLESYQELMRMQI
jgi:flagellar hook-basal body complex protein FliE